jgi:cob(I)alamin adenosyltransferase
MKIYTRTGDDGETGLFGGPRVRKDDVRIEAYGSVDELNAFLGLARCETLPPLVEQLLAEVQNELFAVGAELATPDPKRQGVVLLQETHVYRLEQAIDALEKQLPPLKQFIIPGGSRGACQLHAARAICRRAERHVVTLAATPSGNVDARLIRYLNRLGDYLFVAARFACHSAGAAEIPWRKPEANC